MILNKIKYAFSILTISTISMTNLFAYDGVIKDKYGRVTGYLNKEGDKTYMIDKYGRRGDSISTTNSSAYDGVIKDTYGRSTGYLDKRGDNTYLLDEYGRSSDYIDGNGNIKDKYGRLKGSIEVDD